MAIRGLARLFGLSLAALAGLSGCHPLHIEIAAASITAGSDASSDRVSVRLRREDVAALAENEVYPHVIVFECGNDGVRYPASPRFGNMPMDDFGALQATLRAHGRDQLVDIEADVIHSFVDRLRRVCVKMDGGDIAKETCVEHGGSQSRIPEYPIVFCDCSLGRSSVKALGYLMIVLSLFWCLKPAQSRSPLLGRPRLCATYCRSRTITSIMGAPSWHLIASSILRSMPTPRSLRSTGWRAGPTRLQVPTHPRSEARRARG